METGEPNLARRSRTGSSRDSRKKIKGGTARRSRGDNNVEYRETGEPSLARRRIRPSLDGSRIMGDGLGAQGDT